MESTGEPLKIQATETTIEILQNFPEFSYEFRGFVAVKVSDISQEWIN